MEGSETRRRGSAVLSKEGSSSKKVSDFKKPVLKRQPSGYRPIKTGPLFDFSTFDEERHSRIINISCWLRVNVPAIIISIITYIGLRAFTLGIDSKDFGQIVTWRNFIVFYVFGAIRGYFYVIYLYFVFRDRQKYFSEVHKEMENGRSFWSHVLWCCARTGYSAMMMHIFNIFGTLYFYGLSDEFEPAIHNIWDQEGVSSLINYMLWLLLFKKFGIFVLKMFFWEIWFDFGHYWGHRMGHAIKVLYDFGHSVHHESISPDAWDGLNITFDDALLTNFLPNMFSMFLTTSLFGSSFAMYEYNLLSSYKTFVEVTGHVGVDFKGHSFPIFPPLPYFLGIDIGTAAYHSLHHKYYVVNFAKRFSLWDRVFGTMKIPPVLPTGTKQEMSVRMKKIF